MQARNAFQKKHENQEKALQTAANQACKALTVSFAAMEVFLIWDHPIIHKATT